MINFDKIPMDTIVTIYSEDMEEEFLSGFITIYSSEELILACVDRYGEYNGFLLLRTEEIYRVDYGSYYEKKLELLYDSKKQYHESIKAREDDIYLMDALLDWAYKKNKVVTVKFSASSSEVCGYIEEIEKYKIKNIDRYECKVNQGSTYIEPEKSDYIWVDERCARDAGKVYKIRGDF